MTQIVGRRLGRYEVQQEIGRGGMARVYRALDTLLQRSVAIKVLAPQLGLDPEFARRFEREAITAANLRHPAIVTVYDVGEQDGLRYIAMEFIRGRTLHAIISERGALGLGSCVSLLEPVARALDYAHSQGAVHRDIKPHNIMVDVDGRVLLTDFGIAQAPEHEPGERLTRTGIFMGTPEYISPEQAEARRVDGRSDLYSLGIVAYEIITGKVPFSGGTPQLIVAHAQLPPPPPTTLAADLPSDVDTVLARALAKAPTSRYPTGAAMIEALRIVARRNAIALPSAKQLAELATEPEAVDDGGTLAVGRGDDSPAPPRRPLDAAGPGSSLPTPLASPRRPGADGFPVPPVLAPPRAPRRVPWALVAPALAVVALALIVAFFSNAIRAGGASPPGSGSATPALPTAGEAGPTVGITATLALSPTPTRSQTPTRTATVAPTEAPTSTSPPTPEPTDAPAPPTRAPTRAPTRRPPTAIPPTEAPPPPTPTDTVEPYPPPTAEPPTAEPPTAEPPTAEPPTVEVPTNTSDLPPIVISPQPTISIVQ
jgi:serine/threonine-protein kinase